MPFNFHLPLERCSDGPFDVRDFVVKQCFISKVGCPPAFSDVSSINTLEKLQMPDWLKGDVLDVRKVVTYYLALQEAQGSSKRQTKIVFPRVGFQLQI